jgi:uncharacterized RDD family membrane protein YckC
MEYPSALRRYVATLVDAAALWLGIFLIARLQAATGSNALAYGLGGALILLYEPLLTTFASTLGQTVMRFRVRAFEGLSRISIGQAYGRFATKYVLGMISFLTMPARADRRAIHDLVAETIVVEAGANAGSAADDARIGSIGA